MVLNFFNLREQPFGVSPDPRYLFFSSTHREAMASALYGVSTGRGFTAIIAHPGMGKTTLLFDFLSKIKNYTTTVFLFQPQSDARDLMRCLLADIGIDDDGTDLVRMHRKLNEYLLTEARRGRRLVVVLDEAQNLDNEVLEAVRMLSNFETAREKLIHLVLAGQPQLADKLASPELVQLRQRISMISQLNPFTVEETQKYIDHRLHVAGYNFAVPMFSSAAVRLITKYTQGIPRNINNVCFNAMSIGFVAKQRTIDERIIFEVIDDLDLKIRSNAAIGVPAEMRSKVAQEIPDLPEVQASSKVQTPQAQSSAAQDEKHTAATGSDEWIVEFSPSDIDSLNGSRQRGEKPTAPILPQTPKVDKPAPPTPQNTAPPQSSATAAGADASTSAPRVTGGRKHPPRKASNWRSLGPRIVLAIVLLVTLGWLATQAKRRAEAHLAPNTPTGVLMQPGAAANAAVMGYVKKPNLSVIDPVVASSNALGLGGIVSENFESMQSVGTSFELPTFEDPRIDGSLNRKGSSERPGTFFNIKGELIREETLKLAQSIFLLGNVESPRVATFAGVDWGSGCSWLCAHIADILASPGLGSVCVVDVNLRKSAMTNLFGTSNHRGLSDALSQGGPVRDFAKPTMGGNLWLLSGGSLAADQVESANLLNSETMKVRISELRNEFDYVLIDSAPLSAYVDGVMLGRWQTV